jgi:hypothetical protein
MPTQLTEKLIGFFDIIGIKSLLARADAENGMSQNCWYGRAAVRAKDSHFRAIRAGE